MASQLDLQEVDSDYDLEIDEELERDVESLQKVLKADDDTEGKSEWVPSGTTTATTIQLQLCLKTNQELQAALYNYLSKINQALQENQIKKEKLRTTGRDSFKQACTLYKFRRLKSYFYDYKGKHPNLRCDLSFPTSSNYYFYENLWSPDKENTLKKHVFIQAINVASRPYEVKLSQATDEEEIKEIKLQMKQLGDTDSEDQLLKDIDHNEINWVSIAKQAFNCRKSPSDCQQRWINVVSPSVNKSSWTKEEEMRLMKLGKEFGGRRWNEVAEQMKTHRSVFAYFQKYQVTFNCKRAGSQWTKELEEKLKQAVEKYGCNEKSWYAVSKYVGMIASKCRTKWRLQVNPNIKKGRWSPEEDQHLKEAFNKFGGKSWTKVSTLVPNRTAIQCRERWVNVLDPTLNKGIWSDEEDKMLLELCKQYEGKSIPWAKVAASMTNRTDSSCLARWKLLTPHEEVFKYYKTVKMKEKIQVSSSKAPSTLQLTDFDDDMIPEDVQNEIVTYTKNVNSNIRSYIESLNSAPQTFSTTSTSEAQAVSAPVSVRSDYNNIPVQNLSPTEAQRLFRIGVPLITAIQESGGNVQLRAPFYPQEMRGILFPKSYRSVSYMPAQSELSSAEMQTHTHSHFEQLVKTLENEKFNCESSIVEEAGIFNQADLVCISRERNEAYSKRKRNTRRRRGKKKRKIV